MLTNEAAWLERQLADLPTARLDPLLCVGSGTSHAREVLQPWINERVYRPLEQRGVHPIHHEYRPGPGVDIAGDLADPALGKRLRRLETTSVLCCNVLEHIEDRAPVAALLESLVAPGGYLILTVPRRFPYHPDPIDTMFRPTVAELAGEFPGLLLERGEEVECGTLLSYLRRSGALGQSLLNGIKATFARLRRARDAEGGTIAPGGGSLSYLARQTAVTCAVLRKRPD